MEFASNKDYRHDPHSYFDLDLGQIRIVGKSIAGVETVFYFPQWKLCFDTGRAPHFAFHANVLALTHWHLDHAGGLSFFLGLRRLHRLGSLKIMVPNSRLEKTERFLRSLSEVSDTQISYELLPHTETLQLNQETQLISLKNDHCVDSNGYAVISKVQKLKQEWLHKSEAEIIQAKKSNFQITEEQSTMELCFSGDSTTQFMQGPQLKAHIFIMECSFFGDATEKAKAKEYGHAHILDWAKDVEKIESAYIIMTHTSQRYSKSEIEQRCKQCLPKSVLDRLIVFR